MGYCNLETANKDMTIDFNEILTSALGVLRLEQYQKNNLPLEKVVQYFNGVMGLKKQEGFRNVLLGYEFNVYLIENLLNKGVKNISMEVPIKGTRIDVLAQLSGREVFKKVKYDMSERNYHLEEGVHTFEAKAVNILSENAKTQIVKARGYYKKSSDKDHVKHHVFVLADTKISPKMIKKIYSSQGDVLRADINKKDLEDRLEELMNIFRNVTPQIGVA